MIEMTAKAFIQKRDRRCALDERRWAEVKVLLPKLGARYGLHGEALQFALENARASIAHSYECLKAIERSLVPR